MSTPRPSRVYWVSKPIQKERPPLLVFDAGHQFGDVHIYEHKETIPAKTVEAEVREWFRQNYKVDELSTPELERVVNKWVELKLGRPVAYDIKVWG